MFDNGLFDNGLFDSPAESSFVPRQVMWGRRTKKRYAHRKKSQTVERIIRKRK